MSEPVGNGVRRPPPLAQSSGRSPFDARFCCIAAAIVGDPDKKNASSHVIFRKPFRC
jgi:hypothetical protein